MGYYPLISLPTRLTDDNHDRPGTATLLDNIWTNNVCRRIESGVVTVRISDHLPVFAFVGGAVGGSGGGEGPGGAGQGTRKRRLVNEARIAGFAEELECWDFDEVGALGAEGNVANFRNGFRDLYDAAFPWVEAKKGRREAEKPWLDDAAFLELVREKEELYSRKVKGTLEGEGVGRLDWVRDEVNRVRRRLKRVYFSQRLGEIKGDLRATWEVLGEALRGRRGRSTGATCGYFNKG